jgi:hypothetical protein
MNFVNIQQAIGGLVDEVKNIGEVEERRRPNVKWYVPFICSGQSTT